MSLDKRKAIRAIVLSVGSVCTALIIFGIPRTHTLPVHNSNQVSHLPDFEMAPAPAVTKSAAAANAIIGKLSIPSAQVLALPITRGVDKATLDTGLAGAYPWSGPGQRGVFGLAAHRIGAGGPFRYLDQVNVGDRISVTTKSKTYTYRVISNETVDPSNTSVLNGPKDRSRIVLITCTPLNTFKLRIVVTAELIPDGK